VCTQSIVDRHGRVWTGRLVDHLGGGRAEVVCDGKRYVGTKIASLDFSATYPTVATERAAERGLADVTG